VNVGLDLIKKNVLQLVYRKDSIVFPSIIMQGRKCKPKDIIITSQIVTECDVILFSCTIHSKKNMQRDSLVEDPEWDYYLKREVESEFSCDQDLLCDNGVCLTSSDAFCDGKNDCGDNSDEKNCSKSYNFQIKLVGGRSKNEGTIEVKHFITLKRISNMNF